MLVEELDVAIVNTLGNFFAYLMRRPSFNHVETSPSVLRLGTRTRAHKKVILQLALKAVTLNMVR